MITGDLVTCDNCGKRYHFFVWAFANDRCYCHRCLRKYRPQAFLDHIDDGIDLDKEQDEIYNEIEEQRRKEGFIPKMPRMD